jgi:UDP-glucuronate 4-epimerase
VKILITGAAGFIGFHTVTANLSYGHEVIGLDNINNYYDIKIKHDRLKQHGIDSEKIVLKKVVKSEIYSNYCFLKADLADTDFIIPFMMDQSFDCVINLAAQAGVRHSLNFPTLYSHSNIHGFLNVLEGCRHSFVKHLIYASSSSVYGLNTRTPFSENHSVNHPMSLYAATKKANELIAHSYSHLFKIPTTGLRFFTVYGPWGRPDMALMLFADAIKNKKPIKIYNHGNMHRDFTYISDIVESICRLVLAPPIELSNWDSRNPDPSSSSAPYKIFNIGNSNPIPLIDYIQALENCMGLEAIKEYMDMQPGDIPLSFSDSSALEAYIGFKPFTDYKEGIKRFVNWYNEYYC